MKINSSRLRNITTSIIHTDKKDLEEDIKEITGFKFDKLGDILKSYFLKEISRAIRMILRGKIDPMLFMPDLKKQRECEVEIDDLTEKDLNSAVETALVTQKVVCAAMRNSRGGVFCSPRHFDIICFLGATSLEWSDHDVEQGFVDQFGEFLTRKEAFKVAKLAGQLDKSTRKFDLGEELYSEDLY